MKTFMLLSFVLLGWAFYVMSGGSDFVPERRVTAAASTSVPADPTPDEDALTELALSPTTSGDADTIQERLATALVSPSVTADPLAPVEDEATAPLLETAIEVDEQIDDVIETTEAIVEDVTQTAQAVVADQITAIEDDIAPLVPINEEIIEAPAPDLRQVAGSRVNMRAGPSTDFSVLVTLDGGTTTEVIDRNSDGWVLVRVQDTGQEGWMAERLLSPANG